MMTMTEVGAALELIGFAANGTYVPDMSCGEKKVSDMRLRWRMALLFKGRVVREFDYTQGIGHLAGFDAFRPLLSVDEREALVRSVKGGLKYRLGHVHSDAKLQPPSLEDTLLSLMLDASGTAGSSFGEWCDEHGLDDDSIKAKRVYDECCAIMHDLVGKVGVSALLEVERLFNEAGEGVSLGIAL